MAEAKFPPTEKIEEIVSGKMPLEAAKAFLSDPENANYLNEPIAELETYLIYKVARAGNLELVKFMVEKNPELLKKKKEGNGANALQHAVVSGNLDLVKFLIAKGMDPKERYFPETHIMYFAIKYKHFPIFKFFIEELKMDAGECLASNGIQPLYMAMEQEDKELFKYIMSKNPFIENIGPNNYLAYAARMDESFFLEELISRGAPFEIMDPYKRSAFSWAGEDNRHKHMEILLKRVRGIHPEPLVCPGISRVSHEYNAVCDKWWRLYDIFMVRYYCELMRKEAEPKSVPKPFLEDPAMKKIFDKVMSEKGKIENLLFIVPRNIFRNVVKHLETIPVDIKVPEP